MFVSLCTSLSNRLLLQFQCEAPNPLRRPENIRTAVKNDEKYSSKLLCDLLHFRLIKIIFIEVISSNRKSSKWMLHTGGG